MQRLPLLMVALAAFTPACDPRTDNAPRSTTAASPGEDVHADAVRATASLNQAPTYDRSMWLEDSLAIMDAAVSGTPRRNVVEHEGREVVEARLEIGSIEYGVLEPSLRTKDGDVKLIAPYRAEWGSSGTWLLLRAAKGYFLINPTVAPLDREEWNGLAVALRKKVKLDRPLTEHVSENKIYRTYMDTDANREVWHGSNVFGFGDDTICAELLVHGRRVLFLGWDWQGRLERVTRGCADPGRGFHMCYHQGNLWQFRHSLDGKWEGLSRVYYRGKPSQLKEEIHWHKGLRDGVSRTWDITGKLTSETVYEEAFIAPVVHYRGGEAGRASLHKSAHGVSYSAPGDIMAALKVGIATHEVSQLLKLDFSERSGIRFRFYLPDTYLHITFSDGRISERSTGPNGVHLELRPEVRP